MVFLSFSFFFICIQKLILSPFLNIRWTSTTRQIYHINPVYDIVDIKEHYNNKLITHEEFVFLFKQIKFSGKQETQQ